MERARDVPDQAGLIHPGRLVLKDAWHPIAHRSALGEAPIQRILHETPIVLWKDGKDEIHAMEDRCVHRRAPLSRGKIVGGHLQCPYHGWIYDGAGRVTHVPAMGEDYRPPEQCRVATYPVIVRYGHIWIWWGDRARADASLMPDVPFIAPDGRGDDEGTLYYDTSQELLIENILDLTHLDFIHGGFLGNAKGGTEEIRYEQTGEIVTTFRTSHGKPPPPALAALFGFPKNQTVYNRTRIYVRSGVSVATLSYDPPNWGTLVLLSNTPEGPGRVRQDFSQVIVGPWWWKKITPLANKMIRDQDNWILKLQEEQYRDGDDGRLDMSTPADTPVLKYRQTRRQLLRRQAEGDFSYAEDWRGQDAKDVLRMAELFGRRDERTTSQQKEKT